MCQLHHSDIQPSRHHAAAHNQQPFPWHLPIYDAHCHPTDTMDSIASFDTMRASALAIMATRSQDQDLVAQVASLHGVKDCASLRGRPCGQSDDAASATAHANLPSKCHVIPSFGWHPWFSYQMYHDAAPVPTYNPPPPPPPPPPNPGTEEDAAARLRLLLSAKRAHYQSVLVPAPQDDEFIASLPTPTPLSSFLTSTRAKLASYPIALVGEVGIDKAFRLPESWDQAPPASSRNHALTPGGREGRRLSPHKVQMQHQQMVLDAQLRLAGEVGRPVSLHGVQAHGILYDTVSSCWKGHEKHVPSRRERRNVVPGAEDDDDEDNDSDRSHQHAPVGGKPYPPRICLHSYSGSVEGLKQWLRPNIPAKMFFSFSTAVNLGTDATRARFDDVIKAVPADQLLVESDLHVAGDDMDAALQDIYTRVCQAKGWSLEEGVRIIGKNFEHFIFG
ncbi:hypothetical protein E4U43_008493 [Claviceps pusilla]|uniref:Cut9 interacting protein scn1 n=1 Tax=Claviceps pusilla TaxID=123648 RepID=A0A9P7ND11_9HYPO|nr:hypothetical protein E4U43_008493 [Claviceps pusilla]